MTQSNRTDSKDLAIICLTLPDGRLIFQRRTDDAPTSPGMLGFFGGHLEEGEDPYAAAQRELAEETSIKESAELVLWGKFTTISPEGNPRKVYVYKLAVDTADFDIFEGAGIETYQLDEVLARDDVAPNLRTILEGEVPNEL